MKRLLAIVILLISNVALTAQDVPCPPEEGCRCLLKKADAILQQPNADYERALYLYFAAQACDESLAAEAEEQIVALFDKIENLRLTAESRARLIEQQQTQLEIEIEAAQLATRKAIAQNLNNLASRAILEEDMIEAYRLMQYANAYDPDNLQWLDNCHELFVRNAVGYPTTGHLNLLPVNVHFPVSSIAGVVQFGDSFISWGDEGSLTSWDKEGKLHWNHKYQQPIIGVKILENNSGFISWDVTGIIRIHDLNGVSHTELDFQSTPNDVFLLKDDVGILAWSRQDLTIWKDGKEFAGLDQGRSISSVLKKELSEGFVIAFENDKVEFRDAFGESINGIEKMLTPDRALLEISDTSILSVSFFEAEINNFSKGNVNPNKVIQYSGGNSANLIAVTLKRNDAYIILTGRNLLTSFTLSNGEKLIRNTENFYAEGVFPLKGDQGFLVRMGNGDLVHYNWEVEVVSTFSHSSLIQTIKSTPIEGNILYSTIEGIIHLRNIHTRQLIAKFNPPGTVLDFTFDKESHEIICWTKEGGVFFWDPYEIPESRVQLDPPAINLIPYPNQIEILKVSSNGLERLSFKGETLEVIYEDSDIFDAIRLENNLGFLASTENQMLFWNWDGELLFNIQLDSSDARLDRPFIGRPRYLFDLPDQEKFISIPNSNNLIIWDLSGHQIGNIRTETQIVDYCLIPDQNQIVIHEVKSFNVWSLKGDHIAGPFQGFNVPLEFCFLKKVGNLFGLSTDGIAFWDLEGNMTFTKELAIRPRKIVIHPSGDYLLIVDGAGGLFRCDINGDLHKILQLDSEIENVIFLADQKSYFTITELGQISYWDAQGNLLSHFSFNGSNTSIKLIPGFNAYLIYSIGNFGAGSEELLLISGNPTDILKTGNNIGIPDFTDEEKRKYGIDLDVVVDREYLPYPWLRN